MIISSSGYLAAASLPWAVISLLINPCDTLFLWKAWFFLSKQAPPPLRCVNQAQPVFFLNSQEEMSCFIFQSKMTANIKSERRDGARKQAAAGQRRLWVLLAEETLRNDENKWIHVFSYSYPEIWNAILFLIGTSKWMIQSGIDWWRKLNISDSILLNKSFIWQLFQSHVRNILR